MNAPSTVDVRCPRCDVPIVCTLELKPAPGAAAALGLKLANQAIQAASRIAAGRDPGPARTPEVEYTAFVPDLAEKFAAHYRDAGHDTVLCPHRLGQHIGKSLYELGRDAGDDFARAVDRAADAAGRVRVEQAKLDRRAADE